MFVLASVFRVFFFALYLRIVFLFLDGCETLNLIWSCHTCFLFYLRVAETLFLGVLCVCSAQSFVTFVRCLCLGAFMFVGNNLYVFANVTYSLFPQFSVTSRFLLHKSWCVRASIDPNCCCLELVHSDKLCRIREVPRRLRGGNRYWYRAWRFWPTDSVTPFSGRRSV